MFWHDGFTVATFVLLSRPVSAFVHCQLPPRHNTLTILNPRERCTEAEVLDERFEILVAVE